MECQKRGTDEIHVEMAGGAYFTMRAQNSVVKAAREAIDDVEMRACRTSGLRQRAPIVAASGVRNRRRGNALAGAKRAAMAGNIVEPDERQ